MIGKLQQDGHGVAACCQLFKVSQSGYYESKKRVDRSTSRQLHYKLLADKIEALFYQHKGRCGRIRLKRYLQAMGTQVSEKFIDKTMKARGLLARRKRSYQPKTTTVTATKFAPNQLVNNSPKSANQVIVTDITYLRTHEGFLYLSAIMDLKTKLIKGYSCSDSLHTDFTLKSLATAMRHYPELKGAIHHSDRGCQYTSGSYTKAVQNYGLKLSMSAQGYCYDNAAIESFWATLKLEMGIEAHTVFETKEQARQAVFEYIDGYYNTVRIHSAIDYKTPQQAEAALTA